MAYIGNTPAENFVNVVKQDITGNGGQSYSLNHAVSSAADLEVFVNNVQQEPTTAYTVSGSTITFDEAVSATDDIYVIFRARSIGTVTHPATQPLSATTGTFSGAVSGTDGTFTGSLTVDTKTLKVDAANNRVGVAQSTPDAELHIGDGSGSSDNTRLRITGGTSGLSTIQFGDTASANIGQLQYDHSSNFLAVRVNAAERMRIDENGYVTKPNVPAFNCASTGSSTSTGAFILGSGDKSQSVSHHVNGGGHHSTSNGRFTAPVSGHYFLSAMASPSQGANSGIYIEKNGSQVCGAAYVYGQSYNGSSVSAVVYMAANDYANGLLVPFNGTTEGQYSGNFSGFLIG